MSNRDDPFGLTNDAGRTRIRPVRSSGGETAGPSTRQSAPSAPSVRMGAGMAPRPRHAREHPNPLIATFGELLEFAPELERASAPGNAETLRVRMYDALVAARDAAVAKGVTMARADQAAWFVAALLDDLALNTPWGGNSDWPRAPLVVALRGDRAAGTRFFEQIDELQRYSNRDPEMLELGLMCISLGFRGKYRGGGGGGEAALLQIRSSIARLLRDPEAGVPELSPHWRGVVAADEPPRFAVPLWTIPVVAAAVIAAIYIGLSMQLAAKGEQLYALARVLPPPERAEIYRPIRQTEPVEVPASVAVEIPEPVMIELLPEFAAAAPPGMIDALSGREDVSITVVVVQNYDPEVFRSARADLNAGYEDLVAAIARVILQNIDVIGGVTVTGHTDSIPLARTNPLASNQGLSEARAKTIADLLVEKGIPREIVSSEGRAATEPIADDATPEGRARNRRAEIRIEKKL